MGNEGQQSPWSQPGAPEPEQPQQQQPYYGWQYEPEPAPPAYEWQYEPEPEPAPPVAPDPSAQGGQALPPGQGPAASSAQSHFRTLRAYGMASGPLPVPGGASGPLATPGSPSGLLRVPGAASGPLASSGPLSGPQQVPGSPSRPLPSAQPVYEEPLLDMGSSLGYGQGMEYQYFNAPQPSQPMPVLRQSRLETLRAQRMSRLQPPGQQAPVSQPVEKSGKFTDLVKGLFSSPEVAPPPPAIPTTRTSLPVPAVRPPQQVPGATPPSSQAILPPALQRGPSGLPLSLASKSLPAVPVSPPQDSSPTRGLSGQQKAVMARATMILTGSFIVGRILGLLRTSLFSFVFGTSAMSDAYLQAFLVPDLIFNVVAGGALSSAFIPVFTQYMLGEKDDKTAWRIASSALNLALAIMCVLALLAIILAPRLVPIYYPVHDATKINLVVSLTRIMLLQSIIMGGGVIVNSILYARQNFLLPAIGTVLYNVGLIFGLLPGVILVFFGRDEAHLNVALYCATWGVVLGALLQVGIQIPGILKAKMQYSFSFDIKHPGVQQIGRQMLPRVLNAAMLYFSTFVDRALILVVAAAPLLTSSDGLITQYYQALQLVLLPLGIFGMAVSTAAFPTMAENVTLGRLDRVRHIIEDTLRSIFFLSIPSSIGLIVLGLPIIQVLLQHGAFNLDSAKATSIPLAFFALGLAGLASVEILTRSFYAFRDSKTPVIISIAQFVLKILLSLILLKIVPWGPSWGLGALAFATSIAGLLEAAVLLWLLQKKIGLLELRKLAIFAGRVLLASLIMAAGVLLLRTLLDIFLITTVSPQLGFLGTIFAVVKLLFELFVGLLLYVWATRQLGIEDFWKQGPVRRVLERFRLSWI